MTLCHPHTNCDIPYILCAFWVNTCSWRKIKEKSRHMLLVLSLHNSEKWRKGFQSGTVKVDHLKLNWDWLYMCSLILRTGGMVCLRWAGNSWGHKCAICPQFRPNYTLRGIFLYYVVQSLSCVHLFVTPWTAVCQASLSLTISQSLSKLTSIELVMLSNHLILWHSLLLVFNQGSDPWNGSILYEISY